jgi:hypothetical protein
VYFSGADIGAQINTAWGSGQGKTVRVPAGTYNFTTSIEHPGVGYELQCDAGAVLHYTGSGDAIILPSTSGATTDGAGIDGEGGCQLTGTSSGKSGIHIHSSVHTFVRNMQISGFTGGYGIEISGGQSVGIAGNDIYSNKTGIYMVGESGGFAVVGTRIYDNNIHDNQWGVDSENVHCCSTNNGNFIISNVIENNTVGGVALNWEHGAVVESNYFENAGVQIEIGVGSDNVYAVNIVHNYFTENPSDTIQLGYGIGFHFEDNSGVPGTAPKCFINEVTGSLGGLSGVRGVGTNYPGSAAEFCKHETPTTTP